ncbi:MAG: hypothetical protein M4579_002018 [Chaenotheca gracillima]|nr:MAG: hypothetical protein M4579_002018 [Chaenotheca gracillima]
MDTTQRPSKRFVKWPPKVAKKEILGYLKDGKSKDHTTNLPPQDPLKLISGKTYSRDIGCSSVMRGTPVFLFGDTFCKDNFEQEACLADNSVSIVRDPTNPTMSEYFSLRYDGNVTPFLQSRSKLWNWIPPNEVGENGRVTCWTFGGIAHESPIVGLGWCWYQESEMVDGLLSARVYLDQTSNRYLGTRLAQVIWSQFDDMPHAAPIEDVYFGPDEPRLGTFGTLTEDGYIYLWGHYDDAVVLGRVGSRVADRREMYEVWDGIGYTPDLTRAEVVMNHMQHGAFWRSNMFRPGDDREYVFVGVRSWADSKILMGTAPRVEGPWDLRELCTAEPIDFPSPFLYCVFPHPWAFKDEDGELMVTWSEHRPGGVVAAKLTLEMEESEESG